MQLESRYRARSLWLDGLTGTLAPRDPLPGDRSCDVVIVGAGFGGLWAAYSLAMLAPHLEIVVLEAEIAGYGAAGRNAGFVSAGMAGEPRVVARAQGFDGVRRTERAVIESIDHVESVIVAESIDCGDTKGGSFRIATNAAQLARARAALAARRKRGFRARTSTSCRRRRSASTCGSPA